MKKFLKTVNKKLLIFLFLGVFIGIVAAVASAETMHYTDTAEFCSTCHPMETAYQSFSDSTHANLSCNKCHAPTDNLFKKVVFKAKAGSHDIYMNTFNADEIPDVIHANQASKDVIQENCKSCHESSIQNVTHDVKDYCIDCHRQVPHGNKKNYKNDDWFKPQKYDINGLDKQKSDEKG